MPSLKRKNKGSKKPANSGNAVYGSLDTEGVSVSRSSRVSHFFVRHMLYLLLQSCHYSVLHETQGVAEHDYNLSLVKRYRDS